MSKRYGRQQKRRARAEIERLQKEAEYAKTTLYQERAINARNRQTVEIVARVLGKNFVALPPDSHIIRTLNDLTPRWQYWGYTDPMSVIDYEIGRAPPQDFVRTALSIPLIRTHIVESDLLDAVHFCMEYDGVPVAYALSNMAMATAPKDYIVEQVSKQLARMFYANMNEKPSAERGAA